LSYSNCYQEGHQQNQLFRQKFRFAVLLPEHQFANLALKSEMAVLHVLVDVFLDQTFNTLGSVIQNGEHQIGLK